MQADNCNNQIIYPDKNDYAFISLSEAAESAREARGKSGNCDGKTTAPKSTPIYGGINGEK